MPICPINPKFMVKDFQCPKKQCFCYNESLEFRCISIHCGIHGLDPNVLLTNLYGKKYRMQVSLAIKASRMAWSMKNLSPKNRYLTEFEKYWYDRIVEAGPLDPSLTWLRMVNQNHRYKISDRMAQVLNTMDVQQYSLSELIQEYKSLFRKIDPVAFAIPKDKEEEFLAYVEAI